MRNAPRVLFFLEPVTYRASPLRFAAWWNFCSTFAGKSRGSMISAVAAAPAVCAIGSPEFSEIYLLDQIAILKVWNFDRVKYSRDLCAGLGYPNRHLLEELERLRSRFKPDIVIALTDNRYLRKVFGHGNVVFMELGPLPRTGMELSIFFDPFGHQVDSALDWFAESKWDERRLGAFAEMWNEGWLKRVVETANALGVPAWLESARCGKVEKAMIVALQPSDWISYEGIGPAVDPITLLQQLAQDVAGEFILVPQWHSSDVAPPEHLVDELAMLHPNILPPPPEVRIAKSELFLPFTDAVATISSNVAAAAAILGNYIRLLGISKFHAIGYRNERNGLRPDLIAFLTCNYCLPLGDVLTQEGLFAEHVLRLRRSPQWLFDQSDLDVRQLQRYFAPN